MSPQDKRVYATIAVLEDVALERERQVDKWDIQHRPDGCNGWYIVVANQARLECDNAEKAGPLPGYTGGASWYQIMKEEFYEAAAEDKDKAARRKELVQAAAVIVAWIEDLDAH